MIASLPPSLAYGDTLYRLSKCVAFSDGVVAMLGAALRKQSIILMV
jgi:hypothetical protein